MFNKTLSFKNKIGFIKTFSGGVHPAEGKDMSKELPVRKVFPKDEVVIPCSMHIGAPAKPIVEVGERVLLGQKIAEASSFISANVHSSVSGTVKAIEDRELVGGSKGLCIVIENDKQMDRFEYETSDSPWSKEYIREAVKDCGVVGMGGACFPTHVKITPKDDEAIDHVIINACECEPYITADYRRMIENPEEMLEGLKIMLTLFPNAKGYIAIEDNKQDCIDLFEKLTASEELIEVVPMKTKYPQGSERHVIYAINKRKMNSSMLPADVGCIVDNVDTVYNIYQAVKFHKPLTSRIITVSGDGFYQPCNLEVSIGMSYQEVIDEMDGMVEDTKKVIAGGPMMGQAMYNLNVPIVKGSSSLLAFMEDDYDQAPKTNCMNCGMCVRVCPQKLVCANLAKMAEADNMEDFVKYYGMECIECGTCNYICPAKRNLTQSIKTMKQKVIAKRKGEKK